MPKTLSCGQEPTSGCISCSKLLLDLYIKRGVAHIIAIIGLVLQDISSIYQLVDVVCQNIVIDFIPPMNLTFSSTFVLAKLLATTSLSSTFESISQLQFLRFSVVYILDES